MVANDQINIKRIRELLITNIIISPGPGRPDKSRDFGICKYVLLELNIPLLGVCLGFQGLAHFYGGKIIHAPEIMHGRLSKVIHNRSPLFFGIPQKFSVVRYHSLAVQVDLPDTMESIAHTTDGVLMGIQHKQLPFWGIQFHPESICTEYGDQLIRNFLEISKDFIHNKKKIYFNVNENKTFSSKIIPISKRSKIQNHPSFEVSCRKLSFFLDPETVFTYHYSDNNQAFWLDSSLVKPGLSRFSFIGTDDGPNSFSVIYRMENKLLKIKDKYSTTSIHESIFDFLNRFIQQYRCASPKLPFDFNCGFVGYFGYELKAECGAKMAYHSKYPDAAFIFADRFLAFDHEERTMYIVALTRKGHSSNLEPWFDAMEEKLRQIFPLNEVTQRKCTNDPIYRLSRSYEIYLDNIKRCKQKLYNGESYEICLTNQLNVSTNARPLDIYLILRKINPAPFAAYLKFDQLAILSSSPEQFLHIGQDRWISSKPMKGTIAREKDHDLDQFARKKLFESEKDRSENLMIVDLLRNDLGKVCEIGSVYVPKLMDVESYATVHQMVSTICGKRRRDKSVIDCIRATFPGGSMTGAPKIRTMEIIDKLEKEARGIYSGSIGFLGLNGSANLSIAIRTAVATSDTTSIGIGGAIVALSDPESEFQEILLKAKALIQAITLATTGKYNPKKIRILGVPSNYKNTMFMNYKTDNCKAVLNPLRI